MEETIVKVDHLSHRYSVQWAVRDINFEIPKHGIYGLLGSNGAGKSTTMNIMCGVLRQSEGDVYIKGISMSKNPVEAKRHIAMTFAYNILYLFRSCVYLLYFIVLPSLTYLRNHVKLRELRVQKKHRNLRFGVFMHYSSFVRGF